MPLEKRMIEVRGAIPTADDNVGDWGDGACTMIVNPVFENGELVALDFRHLAYRFHYNECSDGRKVYNLTSEYTDGSVRDAA